MPARVNAIEITSGVSSHLCVAATRETKANIYKSKPASLITLGAISNRLEVAYFNPTPIILDHSMRLTLPRISNTLSLTTPISP